MLLLTLCNIFALALLSFRLALVLDILLTVDPMALSVCSARMWRWGPEDVFTTGRKNNASSQQDVEKGPAIYPTDPFILLGGYTIVHHMKTGPYCHQVERVQINYSSLLKGKYRKGKSYGFNNAPPVVLIVLAFDTLSLRL
jgi:hypothetical protein